MRFGSGSYDVRQSEGLNPDLLLASPSRTITCTITFLDATEKQFVINVRPLPFLCKLNWLLSATCTGEGVARQSLHSSRAGWERLFRAAVSLRGRFQGNAEGCFCKLWTSFNISNCRDGWTLGNLFASRCSVRPISCFFESNSTCLIRANWSRNTPGELQRVIPFN